MNNDDMTAGKDADLAFECLGQQGSSRAVKKTSKERKKTAAYAGEDPAKSGLTRTG
jgi:hypothetical protein